MQTHWRKVSSVLYKGKVSARVKKQVYKKVVMHQRQWQKRRPRRRWWSLLWEWWGRRTSISPPWGRHTLGVQRRDSNSVCRRMRKRFFFYSHISKILFARVTLWPPGAVVIRATCGALNEDVVSESDHHSLVSLLVLLLFIPGLTPFKIKYSLLFRPCMDARSYTHSCGCGLSGCVYIESVCSLDCVYFPRCLSECSGLSGSVLCLCIMLVLRWLCTLSYLSV